MIKCRLQAEMEKRYSREVQRLCKTSAFETAVTEDPVSHRGVLENVVAQAKATAPLLSSLVLSVGPTTSIKDQASNLSNMKLVAILVILCRSAHRNNSNYLPLMIGLYLYSAGARVDALMLLNRLGLSVSYDVLQKALETSLRPVRRGSRNKPPTASLLERGIISSIVKTYTESV